MNFRRRPDFRRPSVQVRYAKELCLHRSTRSVRVVRRMMAAHSGTTLSDHLTTGESSSRTSPEVSLQNAASALPFVSAGAPIPTPSQASAAFSAFAGIRVSTVSCRQLLSPAITK